VKYSHSSQRTSANELMAKTQKRVNDAIEINRLNLFQKMRERAADTYDKLKSKIRTNELP